MELRILKYFLAVAREESISGAAQALHMTQPTLSRQLMDLEEELGKQLLIRGSRRITLTEEGMLLRKRAAEIRYHLYSGNADDVTERLDKGLLDFGVLIVPANMKKYDYIRLPATDTWGLLMPRDCPLAARPVIRPQDLWDLPIITSRQSMLSNEFSGWLGKEFEKLRIVATYNLVYNASLLVAAGMGYALCLDKLVNTSEESPLCFRPLEPRMEVHLDIVWKKYQVFSGAAERFLKEVRKAFHGNAGGN